MRNSLRLFILSLRTEWRDVATSKASLLVILGGVVMYGLLYNILYRPNEVEEAPIVVVDEAHSHLSRRLVSLLNASPKAEVVAVVADRSEGAAMLSEGSAVAMLYLPHDQSQRVGRGEQSTFVTIASTASFLYFEAVAGAVVESMLAMDGELRRDMTWLLPAPLLLAYEERENAKVVGNALFNPTKGYADYLVPVVLVLIMFQTMVMVVAMTSGNRRTKGVTPLRGTQLRWGARVTITLARSVFYFATYGLLSLFLLGLLPHIFDLPHLADAQTMITLLVPYMLATSLFGQAFGRLFTDRDSPLLLITFFSVGLIFISGISYPLELLPEGWQIAHYLLPAAPATLAFVEVGSMGASIADIAPQLATLWSQTALYLLLATLPSRGFR